MEQRNEPTTGEIVENLRDAENPNVLDWIDDAADRLEQLERENAALKSRAEKAEAERDAAVDEYCKIKMTVDLLTKDIKWCRRTPMEKAEDDK